MGTTEVIPLRAVEPTKLTTRVLLVSLYIVLCSSVVHVAMLPCSQDCLFQRSRDMAFIGLVLSGSLPPEVVVLPGLIGAEGIDLSMAHAMKIVALPKA